MYEKDSYTKNEILDLLRLTDREALSELYALADKVREKYVGNTIYLRGIIEFSNICAQDCTYCGIRRSNSSLHRYRLNINEIVKMAVDAENMGYKTVVLQSGEDYYYDIDRIIQLIQGIKKSTSLAVTMSIGERPFDEYRKMKEAGADRYLLKHETSDPVLYGKLHPNMSHENRINCLKELKSLGFETGSGIMIGLPGQTIESIADDIVLFKELELDMIGMGPYLPHPETPLGQDFETTGGYKNPCFEGLNIEELVYKTLAVTRIVAKRVHLPATTALATINEDDGRDLALQRGANVIMLNVTAPEYKKYYEIYPAKVCLSENEPVTLKQLEEKLNFLRPIF